MQIDLSAFKISKLQIHVAPGLGGFMIVNPTVYVPAVGEDFSHTHGQEIDVTWNGSVPAKKWEAADQKGKAELVLGMIMKLLEHEVREQLVVDGERVLYPHPGPVPPVREQYQPTRKQFRSSAWASWDVTDFKVSWDWLDRRPPRKEAPTAPKPPRARYTKPHGGLPPASLTRPRGRDFSHARGVR